MRLVELTTYFKRFDISNVLKIVKPLWTLLCIFGVCGLLDDYTKMPINEVCDSTCMG